MAGEFYIIVSIDGAPACVISVAVEFTHAQLYLCFNDA